MKINSEEKVHKMKCNKCGRWNELTHEQIEKFGSELGIGKCPHCEHIKFDRTLLAPLEEQIIENFKKVHTTRFGPIFNLYILGSYAQGVAKCRDLDFLFIYNTSLGDSSVNAEINLLRAELHIFFYTYCINIFKSQYGCFNDQDALISLEALLNKFFHDFRKCQKYPTCLKCYKENGTSSCRLPEENLHGGPNIYCLEKCRSDERAPIPECIFEDNCPSLKMMVKKRIINDFINLLKEGVDEFFEVEGSKLKMLDFNMFETIGGIGKTNNEKECQIFKIDPINGNKTLTSPKEIAYDLNQFTISNFLEFLFEKLKDQKITEAIQICSLISTLIKVQLESIKRNEVSINLKEKLKELEKQIKKTGELQNQIIQSKK